MKKYGILRNHYFLILLAVLILPISLTATDAASDPQTQELEELIEQADELAYLARHEAQTEEKLRKAIESYKKVLEMDPNNTHALNKNAKGFYALAEGFLDQEQQQEAFQKSFEYGVAALRANEELDQRYEREGIDALKDPPESLDNVEALFWVASSLGRLSEDRGILDSLNKLPAIVALYRKALEVDETYLGGGPHRGLGRVGAALLKRLPFTYFQVRNHGFSWENVENHFKKALEISSECLDNYLFYAEYYALKQGEKELARELIGEVLSRPLGNDYPLMNLITKEKAEALEKERF